MNGIGQLIFLSAVVQSTALTCAEHEIAIESLNCCMQHLVSTKGYVFNCFRKSNDTAIENHPYFRAEILLLQPDETMLEVFCVGDLPNVSDIVSYLELKDVVQVEYSNCSVQHSHRIAESFGENASKIWKLTLTGMTIEGNSSMKSNIFEGMKSTIFDLTIVQTKFTSTCLFDENFFENFTSLDILKLSENRLKRLPSSIISLENLSILDLTANSIQELNRSTFSNLTSLNRLILNANPIETIQDGSFINLRNLEILDLSANKVLIELPDYAFRGLQSLSILSFINCRNLKKVTSAALSGMPSLKDLRIENAAIEQFPEDAFTNLPNLETIKARSCRLSSLPPKLLSTNLKLSEVDFGFNELNEIPENFFASNSELIEIDLAANNISTVEGVFVNLHNLSKLVLANNKLTNVTSTLFQDLIQLTDLFLESNRIVQVDDQSFVNLSKLRKLCLNSNELKQFGSGRTIVPLSHRLKILDLSRNRIESFPKLDFLLLPFLSSLNLNYNRLTSFTLPRFFKSSLEVLLTFNQIRTVDITMRPHEKIITQTRSFRMAGNPFQCDCHLFEFVKYIRGKMDASIGYFSDADYYVCANDSTKLMKLQLESMSCPITDCPQGCECSERPYDKSVRVSCPNQDMTEVPDLPENVTHLDFQGNLLTEYPMKLLNYSKLVEVLVDNNRISNIDDALMHHKSLNFLSVTGNLLESIEAKDIITFKLQLANNPWRCDCSTLNFKHFVSSNAANITDYSLIHCRNSFMIDGVETTLLKDINDKAYCYLGHPLFVYIIVAISVAFMLLLILIALYYRNQQLVVAYTFIHFNYMFTCFFSDSDLEDEKQFDAFIAYSSSDRKLAMEILQQLEKPADGQPEFRLCIHERDFMPGHDITQNICNSINNSRRTIMILSDEFVKSMWFEIEFRTAYLRMQEDRTNSLIIVIKGDIPPKESMNSELVSVLSTKTYLKWDEKWFWEKLRYAMPHKRPQSQQQKREEIALDGIHKRSDSYNAAGDAAASDVRDHMPQSVEYF